ncbi:hypothetical protein [Azospirillum sp. TSO35-2]|uniref:hypothetical protein n=1 Tax=Azospirillum sp. TSO35-2 TaxID=716796 RepID=UPI0011B66A07|nr:hypothetical protein [Azospirillum sp. TSO35-2]
MIVIHAPLGIDRYQAILAPTFAQQAKPVPCGWRVSATRRGPQSVSLICRRAEFGRRTFGNDHGVVVGIHTMVRRHPDERPDESPGGQAGMGTRPPCGLRSAGQSPQGLIIF